MARPGPRTDARCLDLDEVPDARVLADLGSRTQPGERADSSPWRHPRAVDYAMREHLGPLTNFGVPEYRARSDGGAAANPHPTLQHDPDVEDDVHARLHLTANIDPRSVAQGDPAAHQLLRPPALESALDGLELDSVIDPERLARRGRNDRCHHETFLHGHRHHIGEIVLALCIVGGEPRRPAAERRGGGGDDPGVDLAYRTLGGTRVPVLHDSDYAAFGIASHPAIAVRAIHGDGEEGELVRAALGHEAAKRGGLKARHIAVEDEDRAPVGDSGKRPRERIPGAEGPGLLDPVERGRIGPESGLNRGTNRFAPVDDVDRGGLDLAGGRNHPGEERASRCRLEDLRKARAHPLALAGREDDDLEVRHAQLPPPRCNPGCGAANEPHSPLAAEASARAGGGLRPQVRPVRRRSRSRVRSCATASASSARAFA